MKRYNFFAAALLASSMALGCGGSSDLIGGSRDCVEDGRFVVVADTAACVYRAPIIETGFRCQPEFPWNYEVLEALICARREEGRTHVLEEMVRKAFGASGAGGEGGEGGSSGSGGVEAPIGTGGTGVIPIGTGGISGGSGGSGGDTGTGGSGAVGAGGSGPGCHAVEALSPTAAIDILLVIDDSYPNDRAQAGLSAQVEVLTNALAGYDWHIGVTTTDMGGHDATSGARGRLLPFYGLQPRFVTPYQPDWLEDLQERIVVGGAGSATEKGIAAAITAVTPPLTLVSKDPRTWEAHDGNLGFLREEAHLAIVVLTDEDDSSHLLDLDDAHAQLLAAKGGDADRLSFHLLSNCDGYLQPQTRYLDLVGRTGGTVVDFCNFDAAEVGQLAQALQASVPGGRYGGVAPVDADGDGIVTEADLEVFVDGVLVDAVDPFGERQWRWDAAANQLIFAEGHEPAPGELVEMAFACDPNAAPSGGQGGAGGHPGGGNPGGTVACSSPAQLEVEPVDVDLLFVVDNRNVREDNHRRLSTYVRLFADEMASHHWQIGVTTMDTNEGAQGRLIPLDDTRPRFLTPATPNWLGELQHRIRYLGTGGWVPRGIDAALTALSPPLADVSDDPATPEPNDGNLGFLRAGAHLVVVFVSDNRDHSVLHDTYAFPADFWSLPADQRTQLQTAAHLHRISGAHTDFVDRKGGDPDKLSFHFVDLSISDWDIPGGGSGYHELIDMAGRGGVHRGLDYGFASHQGVHVSEGLIREAAHAAGATLPRQRWGKAGVVPLDLNNDGQIDYRDVTVYVDGVMLLDDSFRGWIWQWDQATDQLVFSEDWVPEPGSVVTIELACTP